MELLEELREKGEFDHILTGRGDMDREENGPACHFFKGYGVVNEVRYVEQQIRDRKLPYGEVALIYAGEGYENTVRAVFEGAHIPYCFMKGLHAAPVNHAVDLHYRRIGQEGNGAVIGHIDDLLGIGIVVDRIDEIHRYFAVSAAAAGGQSRDQHSRRQHKREHSACPFGKESSFHLYAASVSA